MTNERNGNGDVRWLDEVGLHQAVVRGDQEAFAELMRRFDPIVRAHIARVTPEDLIEAELAKFWCGWIADGFARLRGWEPELGGLLAQWISVLAAQSCLSSLRDGEDGLYRRYGSESSAWIGVAVCKNVWRDIPDEILPTDKRNGRRDTASERS